MEGKDKGTKFLDLPSGNIQKEREAGRQTKRDGQTDKHS